MGVDSVGFDDDNIHSFNGYAYANNNPYKYVDPDGNLPHILVGAVVAAVSDAATQGILIAAGAQHDFSFGNLAVATGLGAATGGISNLKKVGDALKLLKNAKKARAEKAARNNNTATQMADDLAGQIGKNRVSARTSSKQINIDLKGKGHFDKQSRKIINTPHVQEGQLARGPNGKISLDKKSVTTRPATKQDIRTARKIVERKK
jgi:hypothetical protein